MGEQSIFQAGTDNGLGRCQFNTKAIEENGLCSFPGRLEGVFKTLDGGIANNIAGRFIRQFVKGCQGLSGSGYALV